MGYTAAFKEQMVRRMMGPPGMTATALSKEVGVSQTQLSRWLKQAQAGAELAQGAQETQGVAADAGRWTAQEKLRVLAVAHGLTGEALGALLRREGLHETQVETWREAAAAGLSEALSPGGMTAGDRRGVGASERRVRELEKELRRKEKALAEAAALLMLEKKLQALGWDEADEDDAPRRPSGS